VDYETPAPELARNLLKLIGGSICLCGILALSDALELEIITSGARHAKSTALYAIGTIKAFQGSRNRHNCGYISRDHCTDPLHNWSSYHRKRPWLKSTVYTINMRNLCVNYRGSIRIVTCPLIRRFSYQYISVGGVAKKLSWRPISDCELVMVDMEWHCEVRFSVDFFVEMARMSEEVNSHKSCLQLRQPWPKGVDAQLRFSICDS
jgi:superfamily II DNA helicase RecQ